MAIEGDYSVGYFHQPPAQSGHFFHSPTHYYPYDYSFPPYYPYYPYPPYEHPCPSCGRCPTCGKGGHYPRITWTSNKTNVSVVPHKLPAGVLEYPPHEAVMTHT